MRPVTRADPPAEKLPRTGLIGIKPAAFSPIGSPRLR
jgi:hypothetical protein